ncbi:MAG: hypothetical protein ACRDC4_16885, partial [Plesiomonas sp.]
HTLAFVDGGFLLNKCVITAETHQPHTVFQTEVAARANAAQVINQVLEIFGSQLSSLSSENLERPTVFKTNLNDLNRMNIVGNDQPFILGLLMEAIKQANHDPTLKIMIFIIKFGQKEKKPLDIVTLVKRDGIKSISCHAACTMSSKDPRVDLLWSRYGLQSVVGHRGSLYTSYGIPEATNLDQHNITLERVLLDVFKGEQRYSDISFVQLYANTPHVHMAFTKHPVSRVIATCGAHNKAHAKMIFLKVFLKVVHNAYGRLDKKDIHPDTR